MIKTWKVWGAGLTTLYIIGKDIDEVLAQARLINPNYNSVQLYSKEETVHICVKIGDIGYVDEV